MKSRLVVGPPPIKYVKKYGKGGALTGFQKAFAEARKEKGKDQVFLYKGKQYSTNYKEEGYPKVTPKLTDKPTTQAKSTPEAKPVQSQQQVETPKRSMLAELQSIGGTRQGGSITSPTPKIGVTTKPIEEKKVPRESMDVSKLPTSKARSVSSTTRRPAEKLKSAPPVPTSKLAKAPVEQAQASAPVETDDDWIRTIMQFEATKGSKEGKGLPNFGYNTASPKSIDEAVKLYKKEYLPKVANLPKGMRERFGDFLYNSGENLWLYMTHLNRLNKGEGGVQDRSKYRVKGGQEGKPGERYQYLEQDFAKDISEISKLPIEEQTKLADQARDWYYKNINTTGGKPSPTYEKSWKYRVGMFNQPEKKMYGGSLPKKQLGGMANVGSTEQAGLGLLTTGLSAIPGVGAILSPIVGALGSAFLGNKQQKDSFNRQYSNIQVAEKGGMIKRKDGSYSRRGLWDNIRANKGSGKKPTKEMLEQERKIKAKMEFGGMLTGKSDLSFYKGRKHTNGGIMVSSKGTPSNKPVAEVEGGETRFKLGSNAYIFSDKLTL